MTLSTLPATALVVNTNTPKTLNLDIQVNVQSSEFKWNAVFNNLDGDLPGVKGAGGYGEYYAEPGPGDLIQDGFWGRNRVLHCSQAGPYQNSWWATADHYTTFTKVV